MINLDYPKNVPAVQALADSNEEAAVKEAVANCLPFVESGIACYEVYHALIDALLNLVHNFKYEPTQREKEAAEKAYEEVVDHLALMLGDIA